jgi:hypothetical protein
VVRTSLTEIGIPALASRFAVTAARLTHLPARLGRTSHR